jgi:hypothetical protein
MAHWEEAMHTVSTSRFALVSVLCLALLLMLPRPAAAGEYSVAACQADSLSFSTRAFVDFATRGMSIKRACNPEGPGLRGLITANVVRRQPVRRGAVSMVAIKAPLGTRFASFRWAGTARRRDCGYALQLYADAPDAKPIPIKNVRANRHCPREKRAQIAGYRARTFNVSGATRIVQRVICVGGGGSKSCSARARNFIRTYKAQVRIVDGVNPATAIVPDTPLAQGAWVSGIQSLDYTAGDNVGVRSAQALVAGRIVGTHQRTCAFAAPAGAYADVVPCPSGPGRIDIDTTRSVEGTQSLMVQTFDAAGNAGNSAAATARIDNTAPARVDTVLEGGEQWRNRNEFAVSWVNPPEGDRAPIAAAVSKLCPAGPGACIRGEAAGGDVSRLTVQVPAQGEWKLSVWRRDAAGNQSEQLASVPVTLRYDAEPPQLAFAPPSAADPTLVSVSVADNVSGVADGVVELSRQGSGTWQALNTEKGSDRLVARVDDASLPAGTYTVRARARDQAGNESSTTQRADGLPMTLTLPLRIASRMTAGIAHTKIVRRTVRRGGKRRRIRDRVTVLKPTATVSFGRRAEIRGRLTNRDGQGVAGASIQVYSRSLASAEQLVGIAQTDGQGRFTYRAVGTMSRTLRFAYGGSPLILPAQRQVKLRVPATSSLRVSRRRVLNGQAVTFSGTVKSRPLPTGGKLVELQVRLSGRWQTFRTRRTDGTGRWSLQYRFKRTRGVQRYRFRLGLPREADYPFAAGASRSLVVRVRGQ